MVADTKARGHYAVVNTQAVTSRGWEYMIARMERACLGVYHTMVYLGNAFQEAFPRGRSAVSRALHCALRVATRQSPLAACHVFPPLPKMVACACLDIVQASLQNPQMGLCFDVQVRPCLFSKDGHAHIYNEGCDPFDRAQRPLPTNM